MVTQVATGSGSMWQAGKAIMLAMAFCAAGFGLQAQGLEQAGRQMIAGDHAGARATAELHVPATPEEDIERLWIIALSHMHEGAPRAALPYLDAVVTRAPGVTRFRLELARALFLIEDDTRARYHFESALSGQLAMSEIMAVQDYLGAMEQRRNWQGHAQFAIVPQSNPTRASGESHVMVLGAVPFPLEQAKGGVGVDLGLGVTWLPSLGGDLRARLHVMGHAHLAGESRLNTWRLTSELGVLLLGDHGQQIGAGVMLQTAFGQSGRLLEGVGLYADFQRRIQPRTQLSLRVSAEKLRYPTVANRAMDGWRSTATAQVQHIVTPQMRVEGGVSVARHDARAEFNRRTDVTLRFGGQYAHAGGVTTGLVAQLGQTRHDAPNPILPQFGAARDRRIGLTASVMHRDLSYRGFAPVMHLGAERQDSTIPSRGYTNFRASIGATRSF